MTTIKSIKANQTVLETGPNQLFFSYSTPVAAFISGRGYVKTAKKYSVTTSKHVNTWTEGRATELPEEEFRAALRDTFAYFAD